jgi:hypothetical protein
VFVTHTTDCLGANRNVGLWQRQQFWQQQFWQRQR